MYCFDIFEIHRALNSPALTKYALLPILMRLLPLPAPNYTYAAKSSNLHNCSVGWFLDLGHFHGSAALLEPLLQDRICPQSYKGNIQVLLWYMKRLIETLPKPIFLKPHIHRHSRGLYPWWYGFEVLWRKEFMCMRRVKQNKTKNKNAQNIRPLSN